MDDIMARLRTIRIFERGKKHHMRIKSIRKERKEVDNCETPPVAGRDEQANVDIIGNLPLELVLHVADNLNLDDVVRCQRVSKRWRLIFSSDAIIKIFLPGIFAELGIESMNTKAANATTYLRWLQRLQSACPVKKVFLPWRELRVRPTIGLYHSRRLFYKIWRDPYEELMMLNLETGETSIVLTSEIPYTIFIRISGQYLFINFYKSGATAVWDLRTSQMIAEKDFENSIPKRITASKDIAVFIHHIVVERTYSVWVWNLRSNQVKEIGTFSLDGHYELVFYHVNPDENVLVTFEICWYPLDSPGVRQTNWSLTDGTQLRKKQFHLPLGDHPSIRFGSSLRVRRDGEISTNGNKTEAQLFLIEKWGSVVLATIRLRYDYGVDRLSAQWIDFIGAFCVCRLSCNFNFLGPNISYRWEWDPNGTNILLIQNATTGTMTKRPYKLHIREIDGAARLRQHSNSNNYSSCSFPWICDGDGEVYCVGGNDGVQLWFFNPEFVPDIPGAEPFVAMPEYEYTNPATSETKTIRTLMRSVLNRIRN